MSAVSIDCMAACNKYAMCYQAAHPEFMPGPNELMPCLAACGADSAPAKQALEDCMAKDCFIYLSCGLTAGLSLMPFTPDGGTTTGGDGGSGGDGGGVKDMSMPDLSTPDMSVLPDLLTLPDLLPSLD